MTIFHLTAGAIIGCRRLLCGMAAAVALALPLCAAHPASAAEQRILLRPDMLLDETSVADPSKLVDEQNAVGDPASKTGVVPKSNYFSGWGKWQYPVHIMIDLGSEVPLTRLFIYNSTGEHPFTLSTGKPFQWKDRDVKLGGYLSWNEIPINTTTRWLRITLLGSTEISELVLYGDAQPQRAPEEAPRARKPIPVQPTMDQFLGTNAFIDDPIDKLAAPVGYVREYHNWSWDLEAADHQLRFQPSGAAGGNAWFFDDYYAKLKAAGVTVCPAIQDSVPTLFGGQSSWKPVMPGKDTEDPASYVVHGSHLYQFTARYGAASVADSNLKLAPGQPRKSGLGLLRYIENWNEPDKNWGGREGRFHPYELAAMCSADYDGDRGRLGKTVGVHNADPKMKLVLGGLVGANTTYLRDMKLWADYNRNGDFPVDVLNFHHYSSDAAGDQAFNKQGISPEADHLRQQYEKVVQWRNANVPDREVWVTEFGYDTNPGSPFHAPAIGIYSAEEVQAIWLMRSWFALAAAGVDRAAMFMFRDVDPKSTQVFATCGMVTEKGAWLPKPSYFYTATLKTQLKGMRFAGDVDSGNPNVLIYRFTGAGKTGYAVWCSTSEDKKVPGCSFAVTGTSAVRVDFENGKLEGVSSPQPIQAGKVTLDVTEKPVLIVVK